MTSKKKQSEPRLIQSIQRASNILDLFVDRKEAMGISDLAAELELPKTTIQGIVTTLLELKFLEKDRHSAKYRLGNRLFQLGMSYATNLDVFTLAKVWTERLCFKYGEPVNVGVLVGKQVLIAFRAEPDNRFMTFPQTGSLIPAHTAGIGKILFAYMKEKKLESILENYQFEKLTDNSIDSLEKFKEELERVRENGIAFDNEENFIGLKGIAAPVYNYTGQVIAAFALSGNAEHIDSIRDELISEIRETSKQISEQLGYNG